MPKGGLIEIIKTLLDNLNQFVCKDDVITFEHFSQLCPSATKRRLYDVLTIWTQLRIVEKQCKKIYIWKGFENARTFIQEMSKQVSVIDLLTMKRIKHLGLFALDMVIYFYKHRDKQIHAKSMCQQFDLFPEKIRRNTPYQRKMVQKVKRTYVRRFYDALNVLEGSGLLVSSKQPGLQRKLQWKQDFRPFSMQLDGLFSDNTTIWKTEKELDQVNFLTFTNTTRGTGADVIIVDEAAHIDPQLFYQTIAPILTMKRTCLICLSSPEGDENYYSQLMNLKNPKTGKHLFRVHNPRNICDKCLKLPPDRAILCSHVKQTAHWINQRKSQMLMLMYSTDPTRAMNEYQGVAISAFVPCFDKHEIAFMFSNKPWNTHSVPDLMFIAVDPNGGGMSNMAIITGYYNKEQDFVIVGMDSENTKTPHEQKILVRRHILRLHDHEMFRAAKKIYIPENTMGMMGGNLANYVRDYSDIEVYYENPQSRRPGVNKTHAVTEDYVFYLNHLLTKQGVLFDRDCFTISRNQTIDSMKATLREELERFHEEVKAPKDHFGRAKAVQTAKMGSKNDDMAVALMQAVYWGRAASKQYTRKNPGYSMSTF